MAAMPRNVRASNLRSGLKVEQLPIDTVLA